MAILLIVVIIIIERKKKKEKKREKRVAFNLKISCLTFNINLCCMNIIMKNSNNLTNIIE